MLGQKAKRKSGVAMACASRTSPARRAAAAGSIKKSRNGRRGGVRRSRTQRRQDASTSMQYGLMLALDSVCLCARDVLSSQTGPSGLEPGQALALLPRHMLQPLLMSFAHWKRDDKHSSFKVLLDVAPCLEEDLQKFLPHQEAVNGLVNHKQAAQVAAAINRTVHAGSLDCMTASDCFGQLD